LILRYACHGYDCGYDETGGVRMGMLDEKTAIVTGGSGDIGLAIAKRSHRISPGGERGHTYIPGTIQE
jgi:hypothetical protein